MRRVLAIWFILVLVCAGNLPAQQTSPVEPGDRIRVRLVPEEDESTHPQLLWGTLTAVRGDTLVLSLGSGVTARVPLATVREVEVSRGMPSRTVSALSRALQWSLFGAAEMTVINDLDDDPNFDSTWKAAAAGLVTGAAVGAVAGALNPQEDWEEVDWREGDLAPPIPPEPHGTAGLLIGSAAGLGLGLAMSADHSHLETGQGLLETAAYTAGGALIGWLVGRQLKF